MYQALYRKYRPKTFDDVCGQGMITTTLKNEIAAGKPSHAYLFTGLRGSGKTSCSKIIAKAVNCLSPVNGNPCCECEICRGVDNDSITDVMEIDAASNSGVDYMRELREQAFYQPVRCRKRVYIIDETHMLSTEAFNALLKIMEEPPEHVLFILATTEVHKVPATIISRCQRFDFKRIAAEDIADRLAYIADKESFSVTRDAALLIARLADGGMRDAISLLDQCWSHAAEIDMRVVAECAGLSHSDALFQLSGDIARTDCAAALSTLGGVCKGSVDMQRLCDQLVAHFRNLLVARCTDKLEDLIVCLPEELEQYRVSAADFTVDRLLYILDQLQEAYSRIGRAPNKRTEMEMALVRVCSAPAQQAAAGGGPDPALEARLARLEAALAAGRATAPAKPVKPAAPPVTPEEARKTAVPFALWADVMAKLAVKNQALHGALAESSAYLAGDLILIRSKNELFLKMIRENEYAKQHIHESIIEVTSKKYRIGPYKEDLYEIRASEDPLEQVLQQADGMGVEVKIKEE